MIDRRSFMELGAGLAAFACLPGVALAKARTDRRLVIIFQRGGQDGLHVLPPTADPHYRTLRPNIALDDALPLTGPFALHRGLPTFADLWSKKELAVFPAMATRYRERSHFDGQNLLENGSGKPFGAHDGFLNRALSALGNTGGMAVGATVPLMLLGDAPVQTWAPSTLPEADPDFLARLLDSYAKDPELASALSDSIRSGPTDDSVSGKDARRVNRGRSPALAAAAVARALAAPDGPRVAVLEMHGWDTHSNLVGRMEKLTSDLDAVVSSLREGLAAVWDRTLIVTLSEFGRTAGENGSRGTDHGTAGTSFVIGGAVAGGRVHGDWPGLGRADLYQGRDLQPVNSTEALLKAVLSDHLRIAPRFVSKTVLPGTDSIRSTRDLLRA